MRSPLRPHKLISACVITPHVLHVRTYPAELCPHSRLDVSWRLPEAGQRASHAICRRAQCYASALRAPLYVLPLSA